MLDLAKAAKNAIQLEKKGYDIYRNGAAKTSNVLGKYTLEMIAKKELDHIKAIEEFMEGIAGHPAALDKATSDINPKEKIDYVKPIMDKLAGQLKTKVSPDPDLRAVYETALSLETDSFNLYKKLSSDAGEPKVKKFFEFLMGEENLHYELLQDTLKYLDDPAEWFKEQERWIVEG